MPTVPIATGFPDSTAPETPKPDIIFPPETWNSVQMVRFTGVATWSCDVVVTKHALLHLLVLSNPTLDVVDNAGQLFLLSRVTNHSSHQHSRSISEAFFSQRPVTLNMINFKLSFIPMCTHQPKHEPLLAGNESLPEPWEQQIKEIRVRTSPRNLPGASWSSFSLDGNGFGQVFNSLSVVGALQTHLDRIAL